MKDLLAPIIALGWAVACALPPAPLASDSVASCEDPPAVDAVWTRAPDWSAAAASFDLSADSNPRDPSADAEARAPSADDLDAIHSIDVSAVAADGTSSPPSTSTPIETSLGSDALRIDRGVDALALWIPRDEELSFVVVIELGPLGDVEAGRVVLSSGVERYVSGLPSRGGAEPRKGELETGWIKSRASGSYAGYSLEHELHARVLPQIWPRTFYTDTQSGSENRKRELMLGLRDGALTAAYRSDGHCKGCENPEHFIEPTWMWGKPHHCAKCKIAAHRVWKDWTSRATPQGTVDMLSAVYLARSMVRDGRADTTFTLIDKQKLWEVHLSRGKRKRIEVPAGKYDAQEIKLSTSIPKGEPHDPSGFEGMFGIRGTIQIWLEARTGVPVLIQGELPVPVLGSLDVRVELKKSRGTPPDFSPTR